MNILSFLQNLFGEKKKEKKALTDPALNVTLQWHEYCLFLTLFFYYFQLYPNEWKLTIYFVHSFVAFVVNIKHIILQKIFGTESFETQTYQMTTIP